MAIHTLSIKALSSKRLLFNPHTSTHTHEPLYYTTFSFISPSALSFQQGLCMLCNLFQMWTTSRPPCSVPSILCSPRADGSCKGLPSPPLVVQHVGLCNQTRPQEVRQQTLEIFLNRNPNSHVAWHSAFSIFAVFGSKILFFLSSTDLGEDTFVVLIRARSLSFCPFPSVLASFPAVCDGNQLGVGG